MPCPFLFPSDLNKDASEPAQNKTEHQQTKKNPTRNTPSPQTNPPKSV